MKSRPAAQHRAHCSRCSPATRRVPRRCGYSRCQDTKESGYVKMGYIVKKAKKSKKWKPLYFALMGDRRRLFYFETETAVRPKGIIDLASSYVYPLDDSFFGRPNCFQLVVNGNAVYLCANTEVEASDWVQALLPYAAGSGVAPAVADNRLQHTVKSLQLTVSEAKDFGGKITHAYCIVSLNGVKVARGPAKVVGKDGSAFWGENFSFDDLAETIHEFSVSVFSRGKKDKEMASVTVPVLSLAADKPGGGGAADWMPMMLTEAGVAPKPNGRIRVKASWTDEVILPLRAFNEFNTALLSDDLEACQMLSTIAGVSGETAVVWFSPLSCVRLRVCARPASVCAYPAACVALDCSVISTIWHVLWL